MTLCPLLAISMVLLLKQYFWQDEAADIRYDPSLQDLAARIVACNNLSRVDREVLDLADDVYVVGQPRREKCWLDADSRDKPTWEERRDN